MHTLYTFFVIIALKDNYTSVANEYEEYTVNTAEEVTHCVK